MMEFNNLPLALAMWRSSETLKTLCTWSGQENTVDVVSREIGRRIVDMKFRYFQGNILLKMLSEKWEQYLKLNVTKENIFIMKDIIAYEAVVNDLAERKILMMQERGDSCGNSVTQQTKRVTT